MRIKSFAWNFSWLAIRCAVGSGGSCS
jgi:hypothetical protein